MNDATIKITTPMGKIKRHWAILLLTILPLAIILRSHTYTEPLECDENIYMLIAKDWIDGGKPYVTLWDNKPIGTFLIYRLAIHLFGYLEIAPKLAATCAIIATTLLIGYGLYRSGIPVIMSALLLLIWLMLSVQVGCYANGANMEVFLLPFMLGAFVLCDRFIENGREVDFWGAYGCLICGILIKPVVLPFFLVPLIILPRREGNQGVRPLLTRIVGVIILMVGIPVIVYALCGYPAEILITQWLENRRHVMITAEQTQTSFISRLIGIPFNPAARPFAPVLIVALLAVIGSVLRGAKNPRYPLLLLGFFTAALFAIALPGSNQPHYYILLLPFLVLGFSLLPELTTKRVAIILHLLTLTYLGSATYKDYLSRHPHEISFAKYGSNWFIRDKVIGEELRARDLGNRTMFVDGTHPGIYVYARNRPTTRFFVAIYYVGMQIVSWDEVFASLRAAPPEICVLLNPILPPFSDWLAANYTWYDTIAGSQVYRRK